MEKIQTKTKCLEPEKFPKDHVLISTLSTSHVSKSLANSHMTAIDVDRDSTELPVAHMEEMLVNQLETKTSESITTPIRSEVLDHYLDGYDPEDRKFLVDGFRYGFNLYCTLTKLSTTAKNDVSVNLHPEAAQQLIQAEVDKGRIRGPYDRPPFDVYHISPFKLVEKKIPNTWRPIINLSYPYDDTSVNANIPREFCSVKYATIIDAIKLIQKVGKNCLMQKSDIQSAFRIVPIAAECHKFLCFKFKDKFYHDTCLAMGASCSCFIFEKFSTALEWILKNKFNVPNCLHILDDFFWVNINTVMAAYCKKSWFKLTNDVQVPISLPKTTEADYVCIFSGIEFDSVNMMAQLPLDKLRKYGEAINIMLKFRKTTLQNMQSIIGCLQYATTVVSPGRAFLRRLIDLTIGIKKPYHRVTLNTGAKDDLRMWQKFLLNHNGKSLISAFQKTDSDKIKLGSDASKMACAAVFGKKWFVIKFPLSWQVKNIAYLELFPIIIAIKVWGHLMSHAEILFLTDNEAISKVINKYSCKEQGIMALIRTLVLSCMEHDILFSSKHISGKLNVLPDKLSRLQVSQKLLKSFNMNMEPDEIPEMLLPENWID